MIDNSSRWYPTPDLKRVYVAQGPGDAHLLRGLLELEGIDVLIRGDDFVPLQGGGSVPRRDTAVGLGARRLSTPTGT